MEFIKFPKIPRYNRDCIITEKIDGTNAQIYIGCGHDDLPNFPSVGDFDDWGIWAGSRSRWLTPQDDNHGFARWVHFNSEELIAHLGPGLHYGEWWGQGIQRKYGLDHKRFSLFNVIRWNPDMYHQFKVRPWILSLGPDNKPRRGSPAKPLPFQAPPDCCHVVPVIAVVPFGEFNAKIFMDGLAENGSYAAPGYMKPEGIVIYHAQGNVLFKKTFEDQGGKHASK